MKVLRRNQRWTAAFLAAVIVFCGLWGGSGISASADEETRLVRIPCGINNMLYYDEEGNVAGHCKDYLNALAKINGWEYEYVKTDWAGAVEMLEDGRIDILFPVSYTPQREEQMEFSALAGGYTALGLFVAADSDYVFGDYNSFDGARIAVTENSANVEALAEFAEKHNFSYEPVYTSNMEEKRKALREGKADMAIFSASNQFTGGKQIAVFDTTPFYYTVKEGNTDLLSELNKGMQQIIIDNPDLVSDTFRNCIKGDSTYAVALTEEEIRFIEQGKKIVVGFYEHTEPLAYVESKGRYNGIYIELLERIKAETALNIELYPISRDYDWKDLLDDGTIDFYIGASESISEKENHFVSTNSFMEYKTVLVTKNNFEFGRKNLTLALTHARAYWDEIMPPDFIGADVVYYETARDCLLAVKRGEVDATLLNTIEFNYQSKNPMFSGLVQWENYRFDSGTGMTCLRSADPALLSVVNKALALLSESQVSDIVNAHINMPYRAVNLWDYLYPARNVLAAVGLLVILVIIVARVAYGIRKKQTADLAASRQREERQLRIMATLGLEYVVVYYVNLDEDTCEIVEMSDGLREEVKEVASHLDAFSLGFSQYVSRFVLPEYQETLTALLEKGELIKRFKEKKDFAVRYQVKPNPQNLEYYEMHFVDISTREEEHTMVLGFRCVDETVREEMKQKDALQEAYEAANRANHAKSDFLSRMSHDIRTPMNAIIGMTLIANTYIDDKERVKDALDKISASGQHLLGLINEVLDMSKIESGKIKLNEDDFRLSELLNNLLVMVQPQIKQHKHELQVHISNVEHEDVIGDSLRLQQVFVNIMSNAVKYTPDGGNIRLTVREKPINKRLYGCYEFVFEDNGIGMSKEYLEHLFEPFTREEDDRTNKIQGTGLGMAIAQNIIQMMNGHIHVESEVGKGSKFVITLFLKLQDKVDVAEGEFENISVLVVDDDKISCETTCEMLNELGMESEWVLSGEEAIERVKLAHEANRDYYAIILDWQMPGMDGVETARKIRRIAGTTDHVVILSAYDWSDMEIEARTAGVDLFLTKPVFKSGFVRLFRKLKNGGVDDMETPTLDKMIENSFSGKRVLLVEDNELNREISMEILGMAGLETEGAENGKIAVEKFAESEPGYYDIIFMDIQMPVMNGYDATRAIRSMDRKDAGRIPIVAMTANVFAEDVRAAHKAGMNGHLAKPFDLDKLFEMLKKYLE